MALRKRALGIYRIAHFLAITPTKVIMADTNTSSAEITSAAKSNLAFALQLLPPERRDDMHSFYAFCRIADDLADEPEVPIEEKRRGLEGWRNVINHGELNPELGFLEVQKESLHLLKKYNIAPKWFSNIVEGCEMDLQPQRFHTWEDLQTYTFRVASSVGVASVPIFGANAERAHDYGIALGHALQLTNILRDVGEDLDNGERIYLPLNDLEKFGYSEQDLLNRTYDDRFLAMMKYQAQRAEELFEKSTALIHPEDHRPLLAPRSMQAIYHDVLRQMVADDFQVFKKRYRVSNPRKLLILAQEKLRKPRA